MPDLSTCRCGGLKTDGVCDKCKPIKAIDPKRQSTTERGYGHDWQKLSLSVRREFPLCLDCLNSDRVSPSTQVHHVQSIKDAPHRRLDRENLVALCDACHEERHRGDDVGR